MDAKTTRLKFVGQENIRIVFKSVAQRLFIYKREKISFKWRDMADIAIFNWSTLILPIMGQIETICFIRCIKKGYNVICVVFLPKLLNLNVTMRKKNQANQTEDHLGRILKMSMSWEPTQCPRSKESQKSWWLNAGCGTELDSEKEVELWRTLLGQFEDFDYRLYIRK